MGSGPHISYMMDEVHNCTAAVLQEDVISLVRQPFTVITCRANSSKGEIIFIDHIPQESAPQGDLPEMRTTALLYRRAMEAAGRKQRKKETF